RSRATASESEELRSRQRRPRAVLAGAACLAISRMRSRGPSAQNAARSARSLTCSRLPPRRGVQERLGHVRDLLAKLGVDPARDPLDLVAVQVAREIDPSGYEQR